MSSLLSSFVKRTRVNTPFETIKGSLFHFELLRGTKHGLRDGDEREFVCLPLLDRDSRIYIYTHIYIYICRYSFRIYRFIVKVERSFPQFSTINASFVSRRENNFRFCFIEIKINDAPFHEEKDKTG